MLQTIHQKVLEAIILGTVGWKYHNEPDFKKLFLEMDNASGVYLVTFLVQGRNLCLTRNEWKVVQETIRRCERNAETFITVC